MFIWDYEVYKTNIDGQEGGTVAILYTAKVDKGKTYKIVRECTTIADVLFWLKHFERLDLETFKQCATLEDDLKSES